MPRLRAVFSGVLNCPSLEFVPKCIKNKRWSATNTTRNEDGQPIVKSNYLGSDTEVLTKK